MVGVGQLADLLELVGDVGQERPVGRGAHRQLHVVGAADLDRLLAHLERPPPAVVDPLVALDLLEVEVADVRREVGEAPRDVGVVADDHARHAGEREARDVERALLGDGAAVQPHLHPDARHGHAEVRVVGEQRLPGRRSARRRPPSCWSRSRRRARAAPAAAPARRAAGSATRAQRRRRGTPAAAPGRARRRCPGRRRRRRPRPGRRSARTVPRRTPGRASATCSGLFSDSASTRSISSVMLPRRSHAIALSHASESAVVHGSGS